MTGRRRFLLLAALALPACATAPVAQPSLEVWRTEIRELADGRYEFRGFNRAGDLVDLEVLPKWSRT